MESLLWRPEGSGDQVTTLTAPVSYMWLDMLYVHTLVEVIISSYNIEYLLFSLIESSLIVYLSVKAISIHTSYQLIDIDEMRNKREVHEK